MKQSYKQLEIIIVDNSSIDGSFEIINKYSEMDKRIKVVRKKSDELVDVTLVGVENTEDDCIYFLDSDNYVVSDFIENFIKEMDDRYDFITTVFFKG